MALGCTVVNTGGPAGIPSALMQMPTLVCRMAGWELARTRAAGTIHCTRMHGWGLPGGTVNAHPTIKNWSAMVATDIPFTMTRASLEMI
jgi:hypothetical protein